MLSFARSRPGLGISRAASAVASKAAHRRGSAAGATRVAMWNRYDGAVRRAGSSGLRPLLFLEEYTEKSGGLLPWGEADGAIVDRARVPRSRTKTRAFSTCLGRDPFACRISWWLVPLEPLGDRRRTVSVARDLVGECVRPRRRTTSEDRALRNDDDLFSFLLRVVRLADFRNVHHQESPEVRTAPSVRSEGRFGIVGPGIRIGSAKTFPTAIRLNDR